MASEASGDDDKVRRLVVTLDTCREASDSGNAVAAQAAASAVAAFLSASCDGTNEELLLREISRHLSSMLGSNHMAVDMLSFELPKVVAQLGTTSLRCQAIASSIIEVFTSSCNPRDLLLSLCEALSAMEEMPEEPTYFAILFDGIAKVLILIKRHHVEQVKATIPIVLKVLHAVSSKNHEYCEATLADLFRALINICSSVREICKIMVERRKKDLSAVLSLFVLQVIAFASRSWTKNAISNCGPIVLELFEFLRFCGLSYFGLITGADVFEANNVISSDTNDVDDLSTWLSLATDGAILAVLWSHMYKDILRNDVEQFDEALYRAQVDITKRWQTFDMIKSILASNKYPFVVVSHGLDLLLYIFDGNDNEDADACVQFSSLATSIFITLQAIQRIIIGAPDALLRKKAFAALKKIISVVPSSERFDILKALLMNHNYPSMNAIIIDLVKEEVLNENCEPHSAGTENCQFQNSSESSWSSHALDLVELVLRPPEGLPSFPEQSEAVLSALNLLRFVLIRESRGNRSSKILSSQTLQKIYSTWLIPLRTLTMGIMAESEKDNSEIAQSVMCALNPVVLVLYRCIELVEDNIKR